MALVVGQNVSPKIIFSITKKTKKLSTLTVARAVINNEYQDEAKTQPITTRKNKIRKSR